MEKTVRAKLRRLLQDRRDTLVDHWYTTLALSSFLALNADEMRHHLGAAVDRIIALLLAEPFDRDVGQDIGVALAALPYLQPEALGLTHDALELHLVRNLTAADQAAIQPRLVALLGALATGFCRQMRASTLAEQEQIRVALLIEQRRMEGALRESEARFRTTFEEASIGIALIDMEKRILESNPALQRMLGYGRDEMRGVVFTTIAHADDMAANAVLYDELVAGKRDRYGIEGRYICKDGHVLCAHIAVSLVHSAGHVPPFTIKMVEDITVRKQVEGELREARRRQMDSREAERVHLAREVHDGPVQELYGVRFRLTALAKSVRNPTSRGELTTAQAMVHEATETLRTMCRDLRPPTLRTFGVEGAIHSHVEQVRAAHPEMAIHVQAIPDGQLLTEWVRVALFRVYQATVNNAVQHAGARVIVIRFEVDMERVLLEVRDDGCGFMIPDRWSELAQYGHLGLLGVAERVDVVRGVARGETGWFSRNVMVKVAERGKEGGCSRRDALSEREKQILRLVAQGKINEEIAAILYITDGTVKNHITNVYRKLGVHTRTQAGTWAWKHGLMIDGVCGD